MRHEELLKAIMEREIPASYLMEKYYQMQGLSTEEKNRVKDDMVKEIERDYPLQGEPSRQ